MSNALEQLDRTLRLCRDYVADEVTDLEICTALQSVRVLCVADIDSLASSSGQTAIVTLASLLSRMGMQVGLRMPDSPMRIEQPPLVGDKLRSALVNASGNFITGATITDDPGFIADLVFCFGGTDNQAKHSPHCWFLTGTDWSGSCLLAGRESPRPWNSDVPFGAMVSAALAAGEAFKFAIRQLPLRTKSDDIFFQASSAMWSFNDVPAVLPPLSLGVDVVSAGAITQSAIYALLRVPGLRINGRIFDHDVTEFTNLNRNMLTLQPNVREKKVKVVAERSSPKLALEPIDKKFLPSLLAENLASRVLVGVDDIPSRWLVQRSSFGWLGVSGTSHFSISSSSHSPGQACCGCLHATDDPGQNNPIPTVSFVSFWAGLCLAVRLVREAIGQPYPHHQRHLWMTPLRPDLRPWAKWSPIPAVINCPVQCDASLRILEELKQKGAQNERNLSIPDMEKWGRDVFLKWGGEQTDGA